MNHRSTASYICNCCVCCCGILRSVVEFGIPTAVAHSSFRAVVDASLCAGCGDCLERCQFGALSLVELVDAPGAVSTVDYAHCVGCGLCTAV